MEIAAYKFPPISSDTPLLLGQVYNQLLASELKLALMAIYPDQHPVFLVHAAGAADQRVDSLPLYAIDRSPYIGHLTALYVPPLPYKATLQALAETVAILRGPGGCPWDQEQTPQSMRNGLLEEVSEVLQALDYGDTESLREELGDVLYHLLMQVQMAAENGEFKLGDIISGIDTKLRRRHPHVWGDWVVETSAEVLHNWEILKREEKVEEAPSLLEGIPLGLPALARSQKIQDRVRRVGFDWPDLSGVLAKLDEEVAELRAATSKEERQSELGDILFLLANLASWLDIDAESALREANLRFTHRFNRLEKLRAERGLRWQEMDLAMMDRLWEEVKQTLANPQ
jgi:tetrapyrrole methylase family protein/MazG family protein